MTATAPSRARSWHDVFQHEALLYADESEYLATTVPFVADGVAARVAAMVAVPEARLSALRDALGDARDHGRGLWMANQLCDLVQLRTFASGTVVRLHMTLSV
ncbi:MAG: hypothetical protein QOE93_937 [Actinomycetota bacterium]|nr:hypothetical protein [Actinomycetota bacterium]